MPDEPKFLSDPPPDPQPEGGARKAPTSAAPPVPAPRPAPPPAPTPAAAPPADDPVVVGDAAEMLLASGKFAAAESDFQELGAALLAEKQVDAVLLGKAALGIIRARLALGNLAEAHELWTGAGRYADSPWRVAILALDQHLLSQRDVALYMLAEAQMHSYGRDAKAATKAVNQLMATVGSYAAEAEANLLPIVARDWRRNLEAIFETTLDSVPRRARKPYDRWLRDLGEVTEAPAHAIPTASSWGLQRGGSATVFHPDGSVTHK